MQKADKTTVNPEKRKINKIHLCIYTERGVKRRERGVERGVRERGYIN